MTQIRITISKNKTFIVACISKTAFALLFLITFSVVQAQQPVSPPTNSDQCVSGNCINGKGKKVYTNGDIYEGDFVTGNSEGQGTLTYKNGDVYTGQFSNNVRNGKGTIKYANGLIYDGNWVDNKKTGKGKSTFPNGTIYDGNWVDNNYNGKGTYKSANGDVYDGNFVGGTYEGQGKLTLKNGDYYTGEWKNFKRNGYGKEYIKATKTVREGIWKDDVLVDSSAKAAKTNAPKQAKTENEWKEICEPYWRKMNDALEKKDVDSAKKIYAEFNAETKNANNSIRVKVELNSLLNQLYLSEIPQLKEFVESELKRLKYTDKEKEDVKRSRNGVYYV